MSDSLLYPDCNKAIQWLNLIGPFICGEIATIFLLVCNTLEYNKIWRLYKFSGVKQLQFFLEDLV